MGQGFIFGGNLKKRINPLNHGLQQWVPACDLTWPGRIVCTSVVTSSWRSLVQPLFRIQMTSYGTEDPLSFSIASSYMNQPSSWVGEWGRRGGNQSSRKEQSLKSRVWSSFNCNKKSLEGDRGEITLVSERRKYCERGRESLVTS